MTPFDQVDIAGMPKGIVLAALFNSSPALTFSRRRIDGLWAGDPIGPGQGEELYREMGPRFEFLGGRLLQVDLSGDSFDPVRYDGCLGRGAAEAAIRPLREAGPMAWTFAETHEDGMGGLPFVREEAPGALPNGSTVIRVNTTPGDEEEFAFTGAVDGDRGVILGSSLCAWGEAGIPIPAEIVYYVEWDHDPKVAYGVLATGIAPLNPSETSRISR